MTEPVFLVICSIFGCLSAVYLVASTLIGVAENAYNAFRNTARPHR